MSTNRFSEFRQSEQDGTTFVTAIPASGADEKARLDASIAEEGSDEDPEANWERVVGSLARSHLGEALTIDEGRGVMGREQAVEALVAADETDVRNEHAAHAVIEYLAAEDILQIDGDDVVVLLPYEGILEDGSTAMLNNWAATLDACVKRIEAAVERVEQNKQTLEKHFENLADSRELEEDYRAKADELKQELAAMLGGRNPSELSEEEQRRFEMKRQRFHRYETLAEGAGNQVGPTGKPEELAMIVEDLEALKRMLNKQSSEFRVAALTERLSHSGARELLENLTSTVSQLSQATAPEEKMDEMSNDEFAKQVLDISKVERDEPVEERESDAVLSKE